MKKEIFWIYIILASMQSLWANKVCQDINFSSNSSKIKDDMVKNGVTADKWTERSSTPIIIGSSKQIDYIYVNVEQHFDSNINVELIVF